MVEASAMRKMYKSNVSFDKMQKYWIVKKSPESHTHPDIQAPSIILSSTPSLAQSSVNSPSLALPPHGFILSEQNRRWMMQRGIKFVTVWGLPARDWKEERLNLGVFHSFLLKCVLPYCRAICPSYQADSHLPSGSRNTVRNPFAPHVLETRVLFL